MVGPTYVEVVTRFTLKIGNYSLRLNTHTGSGNLGTVREASPQLSSKLIEQMMTTDQKEKADTEQEHPGTD